jgi:predicted RNA-binding Zn-ribbon protein involved in translation (DUF1610 family)
MNEPLPPASEHVEGLSSRPPCPRCGATLAVIWVPHEAAATYWHCDDCDWDEGDA